MKLLLTIYDWLQKTLRPPSAFSWETLILLSIFSWYMSMLATDYVSYLLINFAWIFLILGVFWGTTAANQLRIGYKTPQNPGFPLSPWFTGALVSLYIFGRDGDVRPEALIYWPIISAIIATIPDFVGGKIPPRQKRQNLVILFGTQILLSCWFQFYFVIQDWLAQYPSLLVDDFHQSAFVVKRDTVDTATPRGALLLNAMEPKLAQQLNSKPWPQVERSLLQEERPRLINAIANQARQQTKTVEEDDLWQVMSSVSSRASGGYNLLLRAIWKGPRAEPKKLLTYSLTKSCQITPVSSQTGAATKPLNTRQTGSTISRFQCQPVKGWGVDTPTNTNNPFIRT